MIFYDTSQILCRFYDFTVKVANFMIFYDFMLAGTPVVCKKKCVNKKGVKKGVKNSVKSLKKMRQ